jgi:N-formylmaleamate deformylase
VTSTFLYGVNIRANGIRQHVPRFGGSGTPLLLVPGITSPAPTWAFVGEWFGRRFDTYVLDVRGRGLSEHGPHLDYSLEACAADVLALAQEPGFDRFHLVGHSMGARIVALAATVREPGADRIVMVDPPVSGPGRRPYPSPLKVYVESIRLAQTGTNAAGMRPYFPTWTEAELRLRAEWLHTCEERAVVESYEAFHTGPYMELLPRIRAPALLMAAGRGGVILPADLDEVRRIAPAIDIATAPNAGHMIPWDDFPAFAAALEAWLPELRTPRGTGHHQAAQPSSTINIAP